MIRRIFDPERPVYAVKPLTTLGVEFGRGEEVDWKAFDFPQRRVEGWFRLRLISHFPGGEQSQEALDFYKGRTQKVQMTTGAKPRRNRKKPEKIVTPVVEEVSDEVVEEISVEE